MRIKLDYCDIPESMNNLAFYIHNLFVSVTLLHKKAKAKTCHNYLLYINPLFFKLWIEYVMPYCFPYEARPYIVLGFLFLSFIAPNNFYVYMVYVSEGTFNCICFSIAILYKESINKINRKSIKLWTIWR